MATGRGVDPLDLTARYTLIGGLPVVARTDGTVQIGREPPRTLLLRHAPVGSVRILRDLNGSRSADEVLRSHRADHELWRALLTTLREARMLVPAADWSFPGLAPSPTLEPERDSLVHRHGVAAARRALRARHDAVVVVRGSGRLATAVATSLAGSGLGHVHQQPDRALRLVDLASFQFSDGSGPAPDPVRRGRARYPAGSSAATADPPDGIPTRTDFALLASNLRRAAPTIKVHPPAAHHRVSAVVLAGDGPPSPSLAAELTGQRIPHLVVGAGLTSALVGPLVLPGRSSCLVCALRHRTERDDARASFEEALRQEFVVPPTQLVAAAAAIGVSQILDHLDGVDVPSTVDGTLEWRLGELGPRRRSWARHPDCGCASVAGPPPTVDKSDPGARHR